ncbi:MAG: PQQ-binding-like beta-propeller repeat protein [Chloroflexi bacterium]|nr:PQQ-binding-like beta-propeller repeat protein [Chloroflexota bacterium]
MIPFLRGNGGGSKARFLRRVLVLFLPFVLLGAGCTGAIFPSAAWAAPLLLDGQIVVGTKTGDVVALDAGTHQELWRFQTGAGRGSVRGVHGTPAADEERIYVGGFDGVVYALKRSVITDGAPEIAWRHPEKEGARTEAVIGGIALSGGKVFVGSEDGKLYALDAATGEVKWAFPTGARIWAPPVVVGNTVYVGSMDGSVYAVWIEDDSPQGARAGEQRWQFQTKGAVASGPVVVGDRLYVGSFDRSFYALDARKGTPAWPQPFSAKNWFWTEPLVAGETVYVGSLDRTLYALDTRTGDLQWAFEAGAAIRGTPLLTGGAVIVGAEDKVLRWVRRGVEEERLKLGGELYSPLVSDGRLVYVYAHDDVLYAVDPVKRAVDWSLSMARK